MGLGAKARHPRRHCNPHRHQHQHLRPRANGKGRGDFAPSTVCATICCPFHEDWEPSCALYSDGHYHCFGCSAHGPIEDLDLEDDELAQLAARAGTAVESDARTLKLAFKLWDQGKPIPGTLAERYFVGTRKLDLVALPADIDKVLRFHPRCVFGGNGARHPCLLALFRDVEDDAPAGIHRIGLTADGNKIKRLTLGRWAKPRAIKLWSATNRLTIGEGLETVLLDEREFSAALDSMQREGNVVSRIVRDAWDCPRVLRTLTKHNPTKVTRPHISVLGQITIDELQRKLDQGAMMSGFANRFLYACVRRSQLLPHGGALDPNEIARLGAATLAAVDAARTFTRITMTSAADVLWRAIYPKLTADVPGLLGAATARGDAQTLRLSMVYALLDKAPQIDAVHIKAALALWNYCEASARYIFGDFTGDPLADNILRALRTVGTSGMNRATINNHFGGHVAAPKIQAALGRLLALGKVRRGVRKPNGAGRPADMWFAV